MQANFVSKKSRCSSTSRLFLFASLALFVASLPSAHAQFTFASDNAANSAYAGPAWNNGSDGGTGFGGWGLSAGANSGGFIGDPASNGIDTSGLGNTAFGMFSTGTGYFNASRGFDVGMGIGDSFTFDWGMLWDANTGSKGFDLRAGGSTILNVNNGGSSTITVGGVEANTAFGNGNMLVTLTRTSTGYSFSMTSRSGGPTYTTNISTSSTIDNFNLYIGNQQESSGNRNIYFDDFSITNSGVFNQGGTVSNANRFTGSGNLLVSNNTTLALTGSGNNNYSGTTTVNAGSALRFEGSGTSDFASAISGGGAIVVSNGAGQVNLQANNSSFTGDITVANGSLEAQSTNALGAGSGTTTVQAGGTLRLWNASGLTYGSEALTLSGDGVGSGGALRNITNNNTWQGVISNASGARINSDAGTLTISGNINSGTNNLYLGGAGNITIGGLVNGTQTTGNGALYKDGSGVLTLTNNNSGLTGLVRLLGGTISITNNNSLGTGTLELGGLGTQAVLQVGTNTSRGQTLLIQNNSTNSVVNVASGSAFTVSGSLTQDGTPANTTKFGKDGAGTLILAGASGNTYNGQIQIGNGTVIAGTSTALGTNASTVNRGIDLGLNITDAAQPNNVALLASNGVTVGQSIFVASTAGGGTRTIGLNGSGTATFNNEIFLGGNLTVDSGSSSANVVSLTGLLSHTNGPQITVSGSGTVGVANTGNTTDAAWLVNSNATLAIGNSRNLGADPGGYYSTKVTLNGGTLRATNGFALNSFIGMRVASNSAISVDSGLALTNPAEMSGTGNLLKTGAGTLVLSAQNTNYSGKWTINQGLLSISSANNLGTNPASFSGNAITISNNGTLGVTASIATLERRGITLGAGGGNISVDGGATFTVTSAIDGNAPLTKLGAGTLQLNGGIGSTNVAVNSGLLALGAANRLADNAAVAVANGATLNLNGDDTVGSLTTTGGKVDGTGTLTGATYALNGGTVSANLGTGTITSSNGSTTLNGTSAATTVNVSGGLLALGAADRLANSAAVNVSSGTLDTATHNDTVGSLTTTGGTVGGTGTLTAANYNLNGGTISAKLGAGTITAASGTTSLSGTADATAVNVTGGTLNTSGADKLANSANVAVSSGTLGVGGNDTVGSVAVSSTGTVTVATGSTLTATANSSISGTGKATGGTFAVSSGANLTLTNNATTTTSDLSIGSGSTLSGTGGTTGKVGGGGLLSAGNSPGILTAGQVNVSGGMDFAFEFTGSGAPIYSNANSSRNDLLHLTNGSNPFIGSFTANNILNLYFNDSSLNANLLAVNPTTYLGGFYVDSLNFDIASLLSAATKNFYVADANGLISFNGVSYAEMSSDIVSRVIFDDVNQTSSDFATGTTSGTVLSVTMVPEPSSASLLTFALSGLFALRRRRNA